MSVERAGEWREPSPASSYKEGSSSSDDNTSYEEEVLTPRPEKKGRMEEEQDPTYTPEKTGLHHGIHAPQHRVKRAA